MRKHVRVNAAPEALEVYKYLSMGWRWQKVDKIIEKVVCEVLLSKEESNI